MLLNLDAGERDDESEELWALADVINVACGGHAGDEAAMARIVKFCATRERPRLGAHPSYPDRVGFGRRTITIDPDVICATVASQCRALATIAGDHGMTVQYVKPHGALYHDAAAREGIARAVLQGATDGLGGNLVVIGPPQGALREAASGFDLGYAREGFADRAMRADGTLVPRGEPGALIEVPADAAAQAKRLAREVETICVHADTPGALAIARAVREALDG